MNRKCPQCAAINFPSAKKCRRCGKEFDPVCPECGHDLPPVASFCSNCGKILRDAHITTDDYKTKSLRSRSFEEERRVLQIDVTKTTPIPKPQQSSPQGYRYTRCPECWEKITKEATFCPRCGASFKASEAIITPAVDEQLLKVKKVPPPLKKPEPVKAEAAVTIEEVKQAPPVVVPAPATRIEVEEIAAPPVPEATVTATPKAAEPIDEALPDNIEEEKKLTPEELLRMLPVKRPDPLAVGMEIIKVPGGSYPDPLRTGAQLLIRDFYLGAKPITCGQYKKFLDATGYPAPMDWLDGNPLDGKNDHPVILVSALEAMLFCRWLGLRLPTITEWIVASIGHQNRKFPWGLGEMPPQAAQSLADRRTTFPVGKLNELRGPFGHQDLVGNIRQWVFSPGSNGGPALLPGLQAGQIGLGGSSYMDPCYLAAYGRVYRVQDPHLADFIIGFRCAFDG